MFTAEIGALHFALAGWRPMIVPAGVARGLLTTPDGEVGVVPGDEGSYLVMDHRLSSEADCPARVEYWRCTGEGEGRVAGLFVLVETSLDQPPCLASTWDEARRLVLAAVPI